MNNLEQIDHFNNFLVSRTVASDSGFDEKALPVNYKNRLHKIQDAQFANPMKYLLEFSRNAMEIVDAGKVQEIYFGNKVNIDCNISIIMSVLSDCLTTINLIYPEHSGYQISRVSQLIESAQKTFILRNKSFYEGKDSSLINFLTAYSSDENLFGGKNKETRWSGVLVAESISENLSSFAPLRNYKRLMYSCIRALVTKDEVKTLIKLTELEKVLDLVTAAEERLRSKLLPHSLSGKSNRTISIDFVVTNSKVEIVKKPITGSAFFNVRHENGGSSELQLNSSHAVFTKTSEDIDQLSKFMLEAWALMESDTFGKRKQMLEDVRYDWGRCLRDLILDDDVEGKE